MKSPRSTAPSVVLVRELCCFIPECRVLGCMVLVKLLWAPTSLHSIALTTIAGAYGAPATIVTPQSSHWQGLHYRATDLRVAQRNWVIGTMGNDKADDRRRETPPPGVAGPAKGSFAVMSSSVTLFDLTAQATPLEDHNNSMAAATAHHCYQEVKFVAGSGTFAVTRDLQEQPHHSLLRETGTGFPGVNPIHAGLVEEEPRPQDSHTSRYNHGRCSAWHYRRLCGCIRDVIILQG